MNPLYDLRPATTADGDFLWSLTANNIREYVEKFGIWDEAFQARHFQDTFDLAKWQVLISKGQAIGGFALEHHPQALFLADLHLLPEYQGRGIGTAVVRTLISEAHSTSLPLLLQVLDSNPRARLFYERLGFSFLCPSPMVNYSVLISRPAG